MHFNQVLYNETKGIRCTIDSPVNMPLDNWLMVYQQSPANRLHLSQKYTWIFVRGHYLSRDALWGPDNVQRQIREHFFRPNGGFCVVLQIYRSTRGKIVYEQLTVYGFRCSLFSVIWYDFTNKRNIFLILYSHSMFFDLELNFVRRVFHIGRKVWKLGNIIWGIFHYSASACCI